MKGVLMMEQLRNKMHDKAERYLLRIEDTARALGIHIDAVKTLVEMELLPCVRINPGLEQRFREDDIRLLLLK
jgi:hypothetical protein